MPIKRGLSATVILGGVATTILAAVYAHIRTKGSEDLKGPLAVLDHVFDFTVAAGLCLIVVMVGYAICKKFRLSFVSAAETIAFSFFLGTGVVGLSVLGLGLLGLLRSLPVIILLSLSIALTAKEGLNLYNILRQGIRTATLTRETQVISALFLCLMTVFILRAATPPGAPDELIYHLPVPAQFVQQGRVFPMYDNSLGNMPFLIHMIYALCLLAGSDIAARLFSFFLAVATAFALYAFCIRFLSRRTGVIALFAFFGAGMVVEVAITTRIDVALAGMLFLATYSMMTYLSTERLGWLWLSAVFAGFSLGIKHSAGLWLLLIGAMYLVERLFNKRERIVRVLKQGVVYALLALVVASPWYIKNYVWFHNPVYPVLAGEVASFSPEDLRYFNAEDEQKLDAHFARARRELPQIVTAQEEELGRFISQRLVRHPLRLWEFFTQPNTYLMSEPYHFPNYLFLFIPLLVFAPRNRWVCWLLGISVVFVLSMAWRSWIARFLLPAYPALTIVAAYTLASLADHGLAKSIVNQRLIMFMLAVALSVPVGVSIASMRYFNSFRFLLGSISRSEFLRQFSYYRGIDFINRELPANARVMIVGAQLNYGIRREYLTDETWFATKWRRLLVANNSLEEVQQDLKRRGFTHIYYSPELFKYAALMGVKGAGGMDLIFRDSQGSSEEAQRLGPEYLLLRNWSTFTLFSKEFLEPVYSDENGRQILRIK